MHRRILWGLRRLCLCLPGLEWCETPVRSTNRAFTEQNRKRVLTIVIGPADTTGRLDLISCSSHDVEKRQVQGSSPSLLPNKRSKICYLSFLSYSGVVLLYHTTETHSLTLQQFSVARSRSDPSHTLSRNRLGTPIRSVTQIAGTFLEASHIKLINFSQEGRLPPEKDGVFFFLWDPKHRVMSPVA